MNYQSLFDNIQKKINLDEATYGLIEEGFKLRKIKKNDFLLQKGDRCDLIAFVYKGCFKTYITEDSGKEFILYFAIDDWWLSDIDSFNNLVPSELNIQALEDSEVLVINQSKFEYLTNTIPLFDKLFRIMTQNFLVSTQRRLLSTLSKTAEERYLKFINTYPNINKKVNNKHIAAYLGVTSEMISIIRNRIAKRKSSKR